MDKYDHEGVVGEGSYGVVIKCRNRENGQIVAIKKFLETDEDQTVKKIAMREIRMLKRLRHENLINLIEVFRRKRKLYLVFEFVDHTVLEELEENPKGLTVETTRSYIFQVLRGIEFCHKNNVIHRDIKPENVLVSKLGVVKLCDFGFARLMAAPGEAYTDYVATRWYRAPELLVGDTQYGKEVDVWAIGCLYAEMRSGDPLFPGESDIDQLFQITQLIGPLSAKHRQLISRNSMYNGLNAPASKLSNSKSLETTFPTWSDASLSFIKVCLQMEPSARPNCTELLKYPLFTQDNFHITFPQQLQSKLQHEFGTGTNPNLRKKLQSGRKGSKFGDDPKKEFSVRRRLNSDTFDTLHIGSTDMYSKTSILSSIYGHGKLSLNSEESVPRSKFVAPPATMTLEMGRNMSAKSEVQMQISPARNLGFQSPDSRQTALGFTTSPIRLKRYEGFETGLNNLIQPSKITPYQRNNDTPNRNKSPPLKKTRRKETVAGSQHNNNNNNNFQQPLRILGSATTLEPTKNDHSQQQQQQQRTNWQNEQQSQDRFSFLEKAFDKAFQLEDSAFGKACESGVNDHHHHHLPAHTFNLSSSTTTTTTISTPSSTQQQQQQQQQSNGTNGLKKHNIGKSGSMGNGSEALSLPSVLGASLKPGDPHAGTGRNSNIGQATNVGQNQGMKFPKSRKHTTTTQSNFLDPSEDINVDSRPPSHNLPYV